MTPLDETSGSTWIAVPTYWTFPSAEPGVESTVFDHPTPLDEEGTLARTLESFGCLSGDFRVIVVAAAAHPDLGRQTHERVLALLKPFASDVALYLVSPANVDSVNAQLPEPILSLDGYGNIRNVQLAVPFAAGAKAVVGIDDDEVIEDPTYLAKVDRFIGRRFKGDTVGGMAGPYFDAAGEYRIAGAEAMADWQNIFLKKNYFMNEALKKVMTTPCPDGLVKSNVAFGGNMVMSRETIARVCHDPYIPRGEDYDYVINAAMAGITFYFQPGMRITHLPPDSTGSQAADKLSKLLADISRFIYMREKVLLYQQRFPQAPLDREYLMPYPGVYLDEHVDLKRHGVEALDERYPRFRRERSPEEFVEEAEAAARVKAREYFEYQEMWRRALSEAGMKQHSPQAWRPFLVEA